MLLELLARTARQRGNMPAVADEHLELNYKQLFRLAAVFREIISRQDQAPRIGILLPACALFPAAFFGAIWANRVAVPLNFLLAPGELAELVRRAGIETVLTVKPLAASTAELPANTLFIEDLQLKRKAMLSLLKPTPPMPTPDPDNTAVILFTSGTSGQPKGVELTQNNLASNAVDCVETANIQPDHVFLNCLPPFHAFGLTANVIAPVALGAAVRAIPRFSPVTVVKTIVERKISVFLAIPSMLAAILRLKSADADALKSIRLLVSGGEPLPAAVAAGFQARFDKRILQGYGLTETSPVCTLELPRANKLGSIGRPIRNIEVITVDEGGRKTLPDKDGEIWVRGPNVMKGYFADPEATRHVINDDGWFKTGDCARIDAAGFVTITGRFKEMLIIGGENVFPREIEAVLESYDGVADVAVIGAPDDSRGEVPIAFVTLEEGAAVEPSALREFARQHLAPYKVPRQVRIECELPKGPTGKILKRKLRDHL